MVVTTHSRRKPILFLVYSQRCNLHPVMCVASRPSGRSVIHLLLATGQQWTTVLLLHGNRTRRIERIKNQTFLGPNLIPCEKGEKERDLQCKSLIISLKFDWRFIQILRIKMESINYRITICRLISRTLICDTKLQVSSKEWYLNNKHKRTCIH